MRDGLLERLPLADVAAGARFLTDLPFFLRQRLTVDEARAILARRLARREADFLALARRAIYAHASSPYRRLLALAGCEYGDLAKLVHAEGLEGALHALCHQGVYLTVEEFKGRRPAVRGSVTIDVDPADLHNPLARFHIPVRSGGSRGPATLVPVDLAGVRAQAVNECLAVHARGGADWPFAYWGVPGSSSVRAILRHAVFGVVAERWFSMIDPAAPDLHPRYRWSARAMRWGARLAGLRLPHPEYVPAEEPLPVAHWLASVLRAGRTPHLRVFPSSLMRLCQVAAAAGIDLRGTRVLLHGEPITAARLAAAQQAGMSVTLAYATMEAGGPLGQGCLASTAPDELHLMADLQALIQPGPSRAATALPPAALLLSSLRPTAPIILLNVSTGDHAVVGERACGCPLEGLGWTTHLHTVRSFEKLTAGGMTFLDADAIRVLEEVLPARFGGTSVDYQLVEEEAADGQPRLVLRVHPAVGPLPEQAVGEAFLAALGGGDGVERVMELAWREAGVVRVERRPPEANASGKILHLQLARRAVTVT